MIKALVEMSAVELRAELDAAIDAEQLADYQDGLHNWSTAKRAAQGRQDAVVAELVRRRGHFEAVSGQPAQENDRG